jgi:polyribonucleotide nucleotidyltransferase
VIDQADALLMVEGGADFLPEPLMVEAMDLGLQAIRTISLAIGAWADTAAKPEFSEGVRTPLAGVDERVAEVVAGRMQECLSGDTKGDREDWESISSECVAVLCDDPELSDGERYEPIDVKAAFKRLASETLRQMGSRGLRQDGRGTKDIRPIAIRMRPLPSQVHGSALFTRGETQALATATLGDKSMGQRYEDLTGDNTKRFYLQYSFPPFSVGEVGRNGAPGRREVGHGNLAERALRPAMPTEADFG